MPSGVASCASGDGQVEPGWLSARLVTEEMDGSASKVLGQDWICFFQQLGSSFQSSQVVLMTTSKFGIFGNLLGHTQL